MTDLPIIFYMFVTACNAETCRSDIYLPFPFETMQGCQAGLQVLQGEADKSAGRIRIEHAECVLYSPTPTH